jgi:hypothetical protein
LCRCCSQLLWLAGLTSKGTSSVRHTSIPSSLAKDESSRAAWPLVRSAIAMAASTAEVQLLVDSGATWVIVHH